MVNLRKLTSCECIVDVAVFVEESVSNTRAEELFSEDTEEGWTCQSTGHVSLQRSTNSEINVLGTRVVSSEFLNVSWRNEIQEIFESCGSLESTELSEVIVTSETVISIPLDIDRLQVLSNWIVQSEQEVLDLSSRVKSVLREEAV